MVSHPEWEFMTGLKHWWNSHNQNDPVGVGTMIHFIVVWDRTPESGFLQKLSEDGGFI